MDSFYSSFAVFVVEGYSVVLVTLVLLCVQFMEIDIIILLMDWNMIMLVTAKLIW